MPSALASCATVATVDDRNLHDPIYAILLEFLQFGYIIVYQFMQDFNRGNLSGLQRWVEEGQYEACCSACTAFVIAARCRVLLSALEP